MKVLIQFMGRKESGPVFTYELAKGLISNGVEVYAILDCGIENRKKWEELLEQNKVHFFTNYIRKDRVLKSIFSYLDETKVIREKFKGIYFDYSIRTFPNKYDIYLFSKVCCKSSINFLHDPIPHSGVSNIDAQRNKRIVNKADRLVVMTKSFIPYVANEYHRKNGEIIFVRHGLLSYSSIEQNPVRQFEMPIHFLFFGRIDPYKGVEILFDAFINTFNNKKSDACLTIAGKGDITEKIKTVAEKNGNSNSIKLLNRYINDDEVEYLFTIPNTVLVLPYTDATQSGVMTLAYQYCIPVIATETGGLKEQLFDGKAGIIVNPSDTKSLSDAMLRFVEVPELYDQEVRKMKEVKEELSWDRIARNLLDAI